jgi:hypothetical protein
MSIRSSLATRFWSKVAIGEPDECWLWTAACTEHGYGRINLGERGKGVERAHRVSWILAKGQIPNGMCVCHKCDNPPCVNPDHLFLGTKADNVHDAMVKGRFVDPPTHYGDNHPLRRDPSKRRPGELNGNHKFSRDLVRAVFLSPLGPLAASRKFGISRTAVYAIRKRHSRAADTADLSDKGQAFV